ncbi:MAG: hypothetical protein H6558_09865 [Lewinellaceae bacterium]|nr:hypothetical protein [Lewinellaceae bacterium]MCB9287017.1 hypothetical protein [Lewinellaceae bacterium]
MVNRSIRVKVLKETSKTVTIRFMTLNRKMPVPRKDFEKRVENGLYEVVGDYELEEDK